MENKQLQLQPRLQLLADLVPQDTRLADIGTDHGYLPVHLIQQGRIPSAIAADVGYEPLQHAVRTAEEYGVGGIDFRLCDGLRGISADEVDTIVIAGMGGETIIHILSAAEWSRADGRYTLLLQPMTKAGVLRRWLTENGYRFVAERLVWDKDFLYPVMVLTGGEQPALSEMEEEYGVSLHDDPLYGEYLDMQAARLRRTVENMRRSDSETAQREADRLEQRCCALRRMREEITG